MITVEDLLKARKHMEKKMNEMANAYYNRPYILVHPDSKLLKLIEKIKKEGRK